MQPQRDVALAPLTTFRLGGLARYFTEARTDEDVADAVAWASDANIEDIYVLGGGSNLVVADSGVPGLVLRMGQKGIQIDDRGESVTLWVAAGELWDDLVRFAVDRELTGIECLSGIPGSVGATPVQNVGAYGQEISQTLATVRVFDRQRREVRTFSREECALGYRDSRFKSQEPNRYIVLNVAFRLYRRAPAKVQHREIERYLEQAVRAEPTVRELRGAVLAVREQKSQVYVPDAPLARTAGSFFVNPIVTKEEFAQLEARCPAHSMPTWPMPDGRIKLAAAWLIEQAGLTRGYRMGPVGLSPHHCLVIVAYERAEARDVVAFARQITERVAERFGVALHPEPQFWGFSPKDSGLPLPDDNGPLTLSSRLAPSFEPK